MGTNWAHVQQRSSDRVALVLQIRIFGSDIEGHIYREDAQTLLLSRNGALILTNRSLIPQEEILIRRDHTGKEAPAQVVGRVRQQKDGYVYGVKILDPEINLWDINFVPLTEEERAVSRMLLECSKCKQREVIYFEEFETEVYHTNRYIYHHCRRCREATIWNESEHEASERVKEIPAPPPPPPPPEPTPEPRTKNERKYNRIDCHLRACIRYERFFEDEVLEINDVSRGGVSFWTRKYLAPGTKIEIAVPYSPGMANIFVPAEIVRLRPVPDKNMYECGAAYIKRIQS
jgi:hypothetical protein